VPLFAAACVPPGGKLDQRALAKVGQKGQQDWKVSEGVGSCDVKPPNVGLEDAAFGFAQSENNNPWRIAQTASMRSAAEANGVELIVTDAQSSTPKQVSDIQDMVAQGVDVLFVPPREEEGMAPALESGADLPDSQANVLNGAVETFESFGTGMTEYESEWSHAWTGRFGEHTSGRPHPAIMVQES